MNAQQRRAAGYVALLVTVTVAYALVYQWGMAHLEGRPVTFVRALGVTVQSFTSTGYGEDAPWATAPMNVLVMVMQLTGLVLLVLTLPLFAAPWVERRLEVDPPTSSDRTDHVVIAGFSARGETLVDELVAAGVPYVLLVDDREAARRHHEAGRSVVFADPETAAGFDAANVTAARSVVLDDTDEANAMMALSARARDDDVRIVSFAEDPDVATYLEYAGADDVLSPHDILGRSLADKVTATVSTDLGETVTIGEDFVVAEMPIQAGSDLDGATIAESDIRERAGAHVVGAWFEGEFVGAPDPERPIGRDTILLVAGAESDLESLKGETIAEHRSQAHGPVVVAGHGEVGSTVKNVLDSRGVENTVVDVADERAVDVVGDVSDPSALDEAGVDEAAALVLALGADADTVFATLVAREAEPDLDIVARVDEADAASKVYAAGADYVMALATVSGRMLADTVLGENVMSLDTGVTIVNTTAPALAGRTLAGADVRDRTGCTVIAVERDGDVRTDLPPDFEFRADDRLVVAGTDEDVASFNEFVGSIGSPGAAADG
ncbi:Trk K+ transport system NAD-binding subunit [Halarchaeum rubridurum]|uniref:Metal transporter n=1 Tax=Halarchaeum rubridurum TaxID=489911 RepID=A0A830G2P0_9EURY|nr:NAD-binding protein [Halarchaeum rubridurum]MBP1955497.1 Trk K+ transport system NAD-binding subunit [Halarchaeum rubridurum]GGM72809.1 metal transporter [Halarchaeum rubridurum]